MLLRHCKIFSFPSRLTGMKFRFSRSCPELWECFFVCPVAVPNTGKGFLGFPVPVPKCKKLFPLMPDVKMNFIVDRFDNIRIDNKALNWGQLLALFGRVFLASLTKNFCYAFWDFIGIFLSSVVILIDFFF